MFTNFREREKDIIDIKELDSTVLKQLVDYIYTGKIMISKENVQVIINILFVLVVHQKSFKCIFVDFSRFCYRLQISYS